MRAQRLPGLRLPGRTVRVRLTAMYGILFFVSGAVLLAIASGVTVVRSSSRQAVPVPNQAVPGSTLAQAQARIRLLQDQLQNLQSQTASQPGPDRLTRQLLFASLIALAIMTVISVALGWLADHRQRLRAGDPRRSHDHLARDGDLLARAHDRIGSER